MVRAYYLIRHIPLAYDNPELRPSVCSALSDCTKKMHYGNKWLHFFMVEVASEKLRLSHGVLEHNTDGWRGPDEDFENLPNPFL